MAGNVLVNGIKAVKPGQQVTLDASIEVVARLPYVSRGGLKLERALREFAIALTGKVVLDIGAATGGFTDCALQHGAARVIAVDVGYGQLAWKLRADPRVVVLERTNIRHLPAAALPELVDFVTIDVSFISLTLVIPRLHEFTKPQAEVIALIKPQFEAGREKVGKRGVVRDAEVHIEVIKKIIATVRAYNWQDKGLTYSPIRGPEGNIEYLLYFCRPAQRDEVAVGEERVREVVGEAHRVLAGKVER